MDWPSFWMGFLCAWIIMLLCLGFYLIGAGVEKGIMAFGAVVVLGAIAAAVRVWN